MWHDCTLNCFEYENTQKSNYLFQHLINFVDFNINHKNTSEQNLQNLRFVVFKCVVKKYLVDLYLTHCFVKCGKLYKNKL